MSNFLKCAASAVKLFIRDDRTGSQIWIGCLKLPHHHGSCRIPLRGQSLGIVCPQDRRGPRTLATTSRASALRDVPFQPVFSNCLATQPVSLPIARMLIPKCPSSSAPVLEMSAVSPRT